MSQCKVQLTVGAEVRYCLGEAEEPHEHIDYRGERMTERGGVRSDTRERQP